MSHPGTSSRLPPGVKAHKFTRLRDFGAVPKSALDSGYALQFTLDQLPNYAEIQAMYDAYSIDKVEVTWHWYQPYVGPTSAEAQAPCIVCTPDYDDALTPTTLSEVSEYSTSRMFPFSTSANSHSITVYPRVAKTLYRTGISSGYAWGDKSTMIDAIYADAPHYGLKWFTSCYSTTYTPASAIRIYIKYYMTGYSPK